jgi:hypothetical protein
VTTLEKIAFKNRLKLTGEQIIQDRIAAAKTIIDNAQQAANNEEKSSAGDKYETARAMSHLEKEMHSKQLAQQLKELSLLRVVNVDVVNNSVNTGACIECRNMMFFIAAGLGKQIVDKKTVFFLSPHAPLARLLQNKQAGDKFVFNGVETEILDVF